MTKIALDAEQEDTLLDIAQRVSHQKKLALPRNRSRRRLRALISTSRNTLSSFSPTNFTMASSTCLPISASSHGQERRTRFIKSGLMGLPIAFLIFSTNPESGALEIIDGSQRLRTIHDFILGDMVLGELEELSRLSGFRFSDLLISRQRKIKNLSIRGIILNQHADELGALRRVREGQHRQQEREHR